LDLLLAAIADSFAFRVGFLLQIGAEAVELLFPGDPVLLHPIHRLTQGRAVDPAGTPLRVATLADEASAFQDLQVFGYRRQAHLPEEWLRKVRHICFAFRQTRKHGPAGRVSERSKGAAEVVLHCDSPDG
jgi:hypothetical protein